EEADESDDDEGEAKVAKSNWSFDVRKVLIVDGALSFASDRGNRAGYRFSAERALAELSRVGNGYDVTCILESVGRRDGQAPAELGQVKLTGRLGGAADVTQLAGATLHADLDVADGVLHATVDSPRLASHEVRASAHGTVELSAVLPLLPSGVVPPVLSAAGAAGRLELTARGGYRTDAGLQVEELVLRAAGVRMGGTGA
ncbi:MAG TPA: hypothetical protein VK324_06835, partial [Tepidisphaeraceae bacterium]|nr:hypothetical protein [Tepidisphaeraceae bacterium]